MTVAAAAAAAGAWLWALLGRANTADACVLALVLIFFWVDVAKVRGVVCLADGGLPRLRGRVVLGAGRQPRPWIGRPVARSHQSITP